MTDMKVRVRGLACPAKGGGPDCTKNSSLEGGEFIPIYREWV